MATPKTSQLANLAKQFPAMTTQGQQLQQSSAALAAAESLRKQTAAGQKVSGAELGAQLYTAKASAAQAAQQKTQKTAMQIGQMQLQEKGMQQQQLLADRSLGLRQQSRKNEQMLQELNVDIKQKLYDKAMKFNKDELGRTKWQTSQLMDYAVRKSKRWQDLRDTEMKVGQMQKRRMTLLKTAQAKIKTALEQEYYKGEAQADRAHTDKLLKAEAAIKKRIADAENKAAEESSMWQAIGAGLGTLAGGVAGAFLGGPAGAVAGAQLGGSLGGATATWLKPDSEPANISREEIRAQIRGQ